MIVKLVGNRPPIRETQLKGTQHLLVWKGGIIELTLLYQILFEGIFNGIYSIGQYETRRLCWTRLQWPLESPIRSRKRVQGYTEIGMVPPESILFEETFRKLSITCQPVSEHEGAWQTCIVNVSTRLYIYILVRTYSIYLYFSIIVLVLVVF